MKNEEGKLQAPESLDFGKMVSTFKNSLQSYSDNPEIQYEIENLGQILDIHRELENIEVRID